jgi:hypothetical protein
LPGNPFTGGTNGGLTSLILRRVKAVCKKEVKKKSKARRWA